MRFAIVGSGIAALSAAETIRRHLPSSAITLISEESHDFYSRPGLAYLLRGDMPEKQLFIRTREDLRALNVSRVTARVEALLPQSQELMLAGGKRIAYDRLLLATGALAIPPPFPGGDLAGVCKLDSLDDARQLLKQAGRGKTVVVVGGGITALELGEGLCARGLRVHYFMRSPRYWSDVLDETESRIVLDRLKHEGIVVHASTQVKQAVGNRGKLTAVETMAGETVPCHILAVAIGVRPRMELARAAGLAVDRGIVVNEFLQSSWPGIYAAGDVAQVHDPSTSKATLDVLWSTALTQGQIAGANMAGVAQPYVKGVSFNVTQLAGLRVTIIGAVGRGKDDDLAAIARGDSETWRNVPKAWVVSKQDGDNRIRLLVGERKLLGAVVMGEQTWSRPLQRLITAGTDVSPIRETLLKGGNQALDRLADFYQQWGTTNSR